MGFFAGPSKEITLQMAQGVASMIIQLRMAEELEEEAKSELLRNMYAESGISDMHALTEMAAALPSEQKMGWTRRNQYLGFIFGSLVSMGMTNQDANYFKKLIEIQIID